MRTRIITVFLAASAIVGATSGSLASGASAPQSHSHSYTVSVLASGTTTMFGPDDLTLLGGDLFVAFQNGIGPSGEPTTSTADSTVAEYSTGGVLLATWSVPGHCDGLTVDSANNRLIGTVNEDGNSSLFTIDPAAAPGSQLATYSYSPSSLPHGGGTDAVSVYQGQILISASAPSPAPADVPAVYVATLSGGAANLQELFSDESTATVANVGSGHNKAVTLGLTDPDSNEVVPNSFGRFGGAFVLDSQGDEQLVFDGGHDSSSPNGLSVLNLSQAIDDSAWVTSPHGTLYATNPKTNQIMEVTGTFQPQSVFVTATPGDANTPQPGPNYLAVLDLNTGTVSPVSGVSFAPKGLLFVPSQ